MDARQGKRIKRYSRQQEKQTAEDLGGKVQAASGALRLGGGGDVRVLGKVRVECKATEKDKYILKHKELEKLRKQAISTLEFPVLQFAFRHRSGHLRRYAVIPWDKDRAPFKCNGVHTVVAWYVEAQQIGLEAIQLDMNISLDRVQLTFAKRLTPMTLDIRKFEIMHWDDFVSWWNKQQEAGC